VGSYSCLFVHAVWSTWDRRPLVTPDVESEVYAVMAAKSLAFGCPILAIGGVADHVHILVRLDPTVPLARLVGEMKGASSHAMNHRIAPGGDFRWQGGYSAFSVGPRGLTRVAAYIRAQKERHSSKRRSRPRLRRPS
jgi:putative transposase